MLKSFGPKTGKTFYDFARGIDDRELNTETDVAKSISVNLNWGINILVVLMLACISDV